MEGERDGPGGGRRGWRPEGGGSWRTAGGGAGGDGGLEEEGGCKKGGGEKFGAEAGRDTGEIFGGLSVCPHVRARTHVRT